MVNWPAMIFSQQSMMGSCVLLPPHSGIGQGGFAISYLTSTHLSATLALIYAADKQNGFLGSCKVACG